jgi:hypothetical protein
MNLVKLDRLEAGITIATDKHGHEHVLAVAKGTFSIRPDGTCVLAEKQQPLVNADEPYGEPGLSSVRYESDYATHKPKTDVVLNGTAYAPSGRPATSVDVTLELGTIRKSVRVYGDRVWERAILRRFSPSSPVPFTTMPLLYERAFGGSDADKDGQRQAFETRNLVGIGFNAGLREKVEGTPLPNLEDPHNPIKDYRDTPRPMALGFVSRSWQPRCRYAGTYDQAWLDSRFPFLPLDFDDRYFQGAPEDQTCDYLQGGEVVKLTNLTPEGRLEFRLPTVAVPVKLRYASHYQDLPSVLDTVIIEPDARRCLLVWRASVRLKGKPTRLWEVWVGTPSPGRRRALLTGKRYVDWSKATP